MSALPEESRRMTLAEYLAAEVVAETKHEFWRGEVFAMAGSTQEHAAITTNCSGEIRQQLKGRGCRVWSPDLRVRSASGLYTYPDMAVVCGKPEFEQLPGQGLPTLVNPTVLVEVLSRSTEARDRGFKFAQYRSLPTLRQYVLVHQDQAMVEVYTRETEDEWHLKIVAGLAAEAAIDAIGVRLALAEVYRDIEFPPPEAPAA